MNVSKTLSKVLKLLTAFYNENVEQRSLDIYRRVVKVRLIIVLWSAMLGPAGISTSPYFLGKFHSHHRILWPPGLLLESKDRWK